jgi:hypothetical protein
MRPGRRIAFAGLPPHGTVYDFDLRIATSENRKPSRCRAGQVIGTKNRQAHRSITSTAVYTALAPNRDAPDLISFLPSKARKLRRIAR